MTNYEILQKFLAGRDKVIVKIEAPADWAQTESNQHWHHHVQVTQWEDSITILRMTKLWLCHRHTRKYLEVPTHSVVRVCANGKYFVTSRGKKSYKTDTNASVISLLSDSLKEYMDVRLNTVSPSDLFVANNPRLQDLKKYLCLEDASRITELTPYVRSRIYKAYDKTGTAAAYKAILNVSSKPLLSVAWSTPQAVEPIRKLLKKGMTADQIIGGLKGVSDCSWKTYKALVLSQVYPLGKAVKAMQNDDTFYRQARFASDLVEQYNQLLALGVTMPLSYNLQRDHDLVSLELNRRTRYAKSAVVLPYNPALEFKSGQWSFESPKTGVELLDAGMRLHMCVGGYIDKVVDGRCQIVIIRKNGEDFACLEISKDRLIQAKMDCNVQVITHQELHKLVTLWAAERELQVLTMDLVEERPAPQQEEPDYWDDNLPW